MAANSFGNFGTFKYKYIEDTKKGQVPGEPIDVTNISKPTLLDIQYFQRNLTRSNSNQVVNYTWEKPSNESPSTYTAVPPLPYDTSIQSIHKNTLDQMAVYKGLPHIIPQNKWESDPSNPPTFLPYPQQRRAAVLSSMTQYVEEMNKTGVIL